MHGLTMDDYQLTLTGVIERAERLHGAREVVSRAPTAKCTARHMPRWSHALTASPVLCKSWA